MDPVEEDPGTIFPDPCPGLGKDGEIVRRRRILNLLLLKRHSRESRNSFLTYITVSRPSRIHGYHNHRRHHGPTYGVGSDLEQTIRIHPKTADFIPRGRR
jgi:hypothetical protein